MRKETMVQHRFQTLGSGLLLLALLFALPGTGCAGIKDGTHQLGSVTHVTATHTLQPATHTLSSDVTLTWQAAAVDTFFFLLHKGLDVTNVQVGEELHADPIMPAAEADAIPARLAALSTVSEGMDDDHLALYALPVGAAPGETATLAFSYSGVIHDDVEVPEFSRWAIADETTGLIDTTGAFLLPSTGYYPQLPVPYDLSTFDTTIRGIDSWMSLSEGNRVEHETGLDHYVSPHPLDGVHVVAGPYQLAERPMGDITVAMMHFEQDDELIDRYLTHSTRYLAMYEEQLGDYPFDRFTVAENWFPTGYGMPAFTLLGTQVLQLPFIVYTSLGHEVLHNWWGNGVLVDYHDGNWCEGLTSYMADYEYSAARNPTGKRQYRLDLLRDYSDYVVRGDDDDFPLREFTSRTTAGSRTIGYGKAMMVFHMAQERIGADAFAQAMRDIYQDRAFQITRWSDFFDTFSAVSDVPRDEFTAFERQWIDRGGAPALDVQHPVVSRSGSDGGYLLEFDLSQSQSGDPFTLDVPVRVTFASGSTAEHVLRNVNGEMYHARVPVSEKPVRFEIDPDFDVFRVLDPLEAPPTLSGFFGAEVVTAVLPGEDAPLHDTYETLANDLLGKVDLTIVHRDELEEGELDGNAAIFFGAGQDTRPVRDAVGADVGEGDTGLAFVWTSRNLDHPTVVHAHIWGADAEAMSALARKLPHYGKYSYLAFRSGQNVGKGQWPVTESPLIVTLP